MSRHSGTVPARRTDWAGWDSQVLPVWLWHALFDGTPLCRCVHSKYLSRPRHRKPRRWLARSG